MPDVKPKFAAAYSEAGDARDVAARVKSQLGTTADLAFAFVSAAQRDELAEIAATLDAELGADCLLGCTAESIACNAEEYEEPGGIALWAASLPGVSVTPNALGVCSHARGRRVCRLA